MKVIGIPNTKAWQAYESPAKQQAATCLLHVSGRVERGDLGGSPRLVESLLHRCAPEILNLDLKFEKDGRAAEDNQIWKTVHFEKSTTEFRFAEVHIRWFEHIIAKVRIDRI